MQIVKKTLAAAVILALTGPAFAMAADRTTANVSVDSVYYSYIDKLSGMGYLKTLPNGARPYSRMQMARWCLEAEEKSAEKPLPAYLADELKALENYRQLGSLWSKQEWSQVWKKWKSGPFG